MRYVVVGGVAAGTDTALLYLLNRYFGVNPLIAAAAGFFFGLVVNYLFSIAWVFESKRSFAQEFTFFAIIGAGGLGWTELILWLGIDLVHLSVLMTKAIALFLVLIWNFGMRKKFVFSE